MAETFWALEYPKPDLSRAIVTFNTLLIGKVLIASPTGRPTRLDVTIDQARDILAQISDTVEAHAADPESWPPLSREVDTPSGKWSVAGDLLVQMYSSLMMYIIRYDLGELIQEDPKTIH